MDELTVPSRSPFSAKLALQRYTEGWDVPSSLVVDCRVHKSDCKAIPGDQFVSCWYFALHQKPRKEFVLSFWFCLPNHVAIKMAVGSQELHIVSRLWCVYAIICPSPDNFVRLITELHLLHELILISPESVISSALESAISSAVCILHSPLVKFWLHNSFFTVLFLRHASLNSSGRGPSKPVPATKRIAKSWL